MQLEWSVLFQPPAALSSPVSRFIQHDGGGGLTMPIEGSWRRESFISHRNRRSKFGQIEIARARHCATNVTDKNTSFVKHWYWLKNFHDLRNIKSICSKLCARIFFKWSSKVTLDYLGFFVVCVLFNLVYKDSRRNCLRIKDKEQTIERVSAQGSREMLPVLTKGN